MWVLCNGQGEGKGERNPSPFPVRLGSTTSEVHPPTCPLDSTKSNIPLLPIHPASTKSEMPPSLSARAPLNLKSFPTPRPPKKFNSPHRNFSLSKQAPEWIPDMNKLDISGPKVASAVHMLLPMPPQIRPYRCTGTSLIRAHRAHIRGMHAESFSYPFVFGFLA